MARTKLSPEEALRRKRESNRKSRQRPEAIQKHRDAARKRRALKRLEPNSTNTIDEAKYQKVKESKKISKQKARADPIKHAHELALRRERRKRKREESITNSNDVYVLNSEPPTTADKIEDRTTVARGISESVLNTAKAPETDMMIAPVRVKQEPPCPDDELIVGIDSGCKNMLNSAQVPGTEMLAPVKVKLEPPCTDDELIIGVEPLS